MVGPAGSRGPVTPLPVPPEDKRKRLEVEVTKKLQESMTEYCTRLKREVDAEFSAEVKLMASKEAADRQVAELTETKRQLEAALGQVNSLSAELDLWSAEMDARGDVDTAALLAPSDELSAQLLRLQAEQHAIDDAMYYLERALISSSNTAVDLTTFLRETRKLARQQFLAKMHVGRINGCVAVGEQQHQQRMQQQWQQQQPQPQQPPQPPQPHLSHGGGGWRQQMQQPQQQQMQQPQPQQQQQWQYQQPQQPPRPGAYSYPNL